MKKKIDNFFFINFPSLLIIILPFTLVSGPFLSDLSVVIVSIIFLINTVKNNLYFYFKNKFFYLICLFWIYLILNSLIQNQNIDSIKISFSYIRYGVFFISLIYLFETNKKLIRFFFNSLLACYVILIFDSLFQFKFGYNIFGQNIQSNFRVSSFFGDEFILGSFLSRVFPIILALRFILFNKKSKIDIILVLIIILLESVIILTGERTSFFYLNLSLLFIFILLRGYLLVKLFTLFFCIFTFILLIFSYPTVKHRMVDLVLHQISPNNENKLYIFSEVHNAHYLSAIKIFNDNKILGVGVKNFRNFCNVEKYKVDNSCSNHPHNNYIQLLSETGLIGLFFLLITLFSLIALMIKKILSQIKEKIDEKKVVNFYVCIFATFIISIWPFAPHGNFFNNWLSAIYYLPVGIYFWFEKNRDKLKQSDHKIEI